MAHAILSPSGASRWMSCTPSARLEQSFPDSSGEAAAEGTLAHALGELILRAWFNLIDQETYNQERFAIDANPLYNEDLSSHASAYASFVVNAFTIATETTKDALIEIEKSLNLTDYIPEGFGTGDAVIIADGILDIIDLKYGKGVRVSCENNKQMMLYGLGALREYDYMYNIHTVRLTIYQPRMDNISSWEISVRELLDWAITQLIPRAKLAFEGRGDFCPGDHCRFCKVKPQCEALAEFQLQIAQHDFQNPDLLTDDDIADILNRADSFTNWIKSVTDFAFAQALEGKKWPGYKLVEGRSNRIYVDQDKAAGALLQAGYEYNSIYTRSLLGITAMEKLITKKTFDSLLSNLVIKPAGKPTLVPDSDKRSEYNTAASAAEDFKNS